jgi:hypothetical protein
VRAQVVNPLSSKGIAMTNALHSDLPSSAVSFGFGNDASVNRLFYVNPSAEPTSVNDFSAIALAAVNEILDDAVLADGMSGTKAWLVQHLLGALRASADVALGSAVPAS